MQKNFRLIDKYIQYAVNNLELDEANINYCRNVLIEILGDSDEGTLSEEVADRVYGALSHMPDRVNQKFARLMQRNSKTATDWFYDYCVKNNYVKRGLLDQNPRFEEGGLVITINKAKPEFRDAKKAQSGNSVDGGYPMCSICRENEGYGGRNKRTLRTVDLTLGGEKWFWQYSPYGYFNEHGIAVNCKHTPMHIDRTTFEKLLDFVDLFPHYFIGCNAPLPRIGGSVLAHDHFQGGGEILPMHRAGATYCLKHPHFDDAIIQVVDWFGTVVRIVSPNRQSIVALSDIIRQGWIDYQNEGLGIIAKDGDGVHSAISPTVLKTDRGYEMSIILRNNITSEQYPDGVFHAHPQYHAIKKESIGLIEAQGLFILPGRLEGELAQVETFIKNNRPLRDEYKQFAIVYDGAKAIGGDVHKAVQRQLGVICTHILQNTAVFKDKKQTVKFLNSLGIK